MERHWPYIYNKTQVPREQWQSQSNARTQTYQQQQQPQAMPQTPYTPQQLIQMRRQQEMLATEVADLRKPIYFNNNNNNIPPPQQQPQQNQGPTHFNSKQPIFHDYNTNNGHRVPQTQVQQQRQPPLGSTYPYDSGNTFIYRPAPSPSSTQVNNTNTEQFERVDPSQRSARTFGFISDLFAPSCVNPCTIDAYNQNRCCIVMVNPPPPVCCQYAPPAAPPPIAPLPPQLAPVLPPRPPINCCNTCRYGFYGPPPCYYFGQGGIGGLFGGGGIFGSRPGGLYIGGGVGNLGYGALGFGSSYFG